MESNLFIGTGAPEILGHPLKHVSSRNKFEKSCFSRAVVLILHFHHFTKDKRKRPVLETRYEEPFGRNQEGKEERRMDEASQDSSNPNSTLYFL
jgi:hypothetical protein